MGDLSDEAKVKVVTAILGLLAALIALLQATISR